ncbi:MAG: oxygen-independent coproporphyrinogen III oxidase [Deltaproteobacteria bacterium]|nr:oxygen-independent coproporphyrinogen III oxidase [Deltaproteobacteria bacterium]
MKQNLTDLLKKYDVPGPRYTSYPTVPAWTTAVGVDDYQKGLNGLRSGEPLSLYFHIPFCENLCHFCGCLTLITKKHDRSKDYVDLLCEEVERVTALIPEGAREVTQFHFGGGSPNFLQPEELSQVVQVVRKRFQLSPGAEVAIEMHPRTSTQAFCDVLRDLGFNRISLGVQDLDPKVQKLINRNQTYEMTAEMVTYLRKLGFESFNIDLIYGLPGQSMEGWQKTLSQVVGLRPDRLAVYSYAHVPWVRPVQRSFKDSDIPPPEMKLALFEEAYQTLTNSGYRLIGMDHFALEEDELCRALEEGTIHRNFMGYSTRADAHQIGFGMSAISYVGGNYFQNNKELIPYTKVVHEDKRLATFRGSLLNQDDRIRRDLIRRIMCQGKIIFKEFESQWGLRFGDYFAEELPALRTFTDDGLLVIDEEAIQVEGEGFLFLRNMAMVFDRYLLGIQQKAFNPVFSRTV